MNKEMNVKIEINRTGNKTIYKCLKGEVSAYEILERNGYVHIFTYQIINCDEINWEGIEFNNLFAKDGKVYRFNNWLGEASFRKDYHGIEIEEIGILEII